MAKRLTNQISFLTARDRLPVRENMNLLFNCDIVNLLLNTNGGETEGLILLFCSLEYFNCWWVGVGGGVGGVEQKILFRTC